jgi:hypothetical protein
MRFASPALLLCAAACASTPSAARTVVTNASVTPASIDAAPAAAPVPTRGHLLTGSVKTEYFAGESLYDVLRVRMPLYLRPRGATAPNLTGREEPVSVFIDENYAGPLETLSLIPASHVLSVQRMAGTEAAIKFGPRHSGGAVLVRLLR